jgi:hypothetical protein
MTCPQCGEQAKGRFCAHCGAATDPGSPADATETGDLSLHETAVLMASGESPESPTGPRSVIGKLRSFKRGPVVGLTIIAVIAVVLGSAALASGGSESSAKVAKSTAPLASATAPTAPPDLNFLFADVSSCADTLDRLNTAVPSGPERVYTDRQGNSVPGDTYVAQDGSIQQSVESVQWSADETANAESILGPQPTERFSPDQTRWVAALTNATSWVRGGSISATKVCETTPGLVVVQPAPAPVAVPDVPDVPIDLHGRGSERVTRKLPPLPKYWADGATSDPLFTSCTQAMLDAVPRIAAGQDASVRADYASTPNLLYWLELEAQRAPKGSAAGALKWMNAPDPTGNTDGEKEGVGQQCVGWVMP